MIIWLASFPRSGSNFFSIVLNRVYGFRTHSIYSSKDFSEANAEDARRLRDLFGHAESSQSLTDLISDSKLHFVKTHGMPQDDAYPAIALVRDGRDALVSYAHFALYTEKNIQNPSRGEFEETLENLIRFEPFGGWSKNVGAWADRVGDDKVVRYEDLVRDPCTNIATALRRASVDYAARAAAIPSFDELHTALPWFFRRGRVGAWRDEMPARLHDLFWELHHTAMERLGYEPPVSGSCWTGNEQRHSGA